MLTDAIPALLRIRAVAALVLQRAGYGREFIIGHLGAAAAPAEVADVTPELLTAAAAWFRDLGCSACGHGAITYYEITVVIERLHEQLVPHTAPDPVPDTWGDGVLFDLAGAAG
jgi:hypothetical protein